MKCPQCGYAPKKGRPKKIDDAKVRAMRKRGATLSEIAHHFNVTRMSVHHSLKRKNK